METHLQKHNKYRFIITFETTFIDNSEFHILLVLFVFYLKLFKIEWDSRNVHSHKAVVFTSSGCKLP